VEVTSQSEKEGPLELVKLRDENQVWIVTLINNTESRKFIVGISIRGRFSDIEGFKNLLSSIASVLPFPS